MITSKMTETPSYVIGNPSFEPYYYKPQKQYPKKGVSLLSIVFSILTYILIFYVFDVSPSSVFSDTKILFFISNTLILLIAADYGAFTDKEKHDDLRDEYAKAKRSHAYHENPRGKNEAYATISAEETESNHRSEIVKDIVCVDEVPEKVIRVVGENVPENVTIAKPKHSKDQNEEACDARNGGNPKPYRRSKSERETTKHKRNKDVRDQRRRYGRSESDSSKWMIVHERSEKEKEKTVNDQKWENVREESEEFSKMSDEELNRRVEEFIRRFNEQMKLQSLGNRQVLS